MNIEIIRGDTKKLKFQRKSTTNEVITEKPDKMYTRYRYYLQIRRFARIFDRSVQQWNLFKRI